jgi:hypothetical protein
MKQTAHVTTKRKKKLGRKVLEIAGRVRISPEIHKELEKGRKESNDRV